MTEKELSRLENARIAACDAYFFENPHVDTPANRNMFSAGFTRAWNLKTEAKPEREMSALEWFFSIEHQPLDLNKGTKHMKFYMEYDSL